MDKIRSYVSANEKISIRHQCDLLGINRSSIYYDPIGESDENLKIMRMMDEYHLDYPTYGVLQMQDFLSFKGLLVNHKRVRRLLRLMGIMAIYPKRNLSKLGHAKYIRPYLLKGLEITRPNQVWEIDITYIPMAKGFMYLSAIIDVYSRFVVGWDVFNSLDAENTLTVFKRAVAQYGKSEIINSDQGSQFTCALWTSYVEQSEIKISMDGKGRAIDNIYIERLWRTVKQDYVYLNPASNGTELYQGLRDFFTHYNTQKTHQGIERQIPINKYRQVA
ncbi:MAG: IS3 family transposase [Bacteroidales bacterium]|nr:IS3 family transposase [Bacteroidales bacterium]MDZ4203587.1 IS3 family transposase [Bacteroidales bacterium]